MADEWRVTLIFDDRSATGKRTAVRGLLRRRLGDDIAVSGDKARIFLYAGTAKAAEEAEYAARDVLAQESLSAETRFECWDPAARPGGTRGPGHRTSPWACPPRTTASESASVRGT
jgi:hypothetical protein